MYHVIEVQYGSNQHKVYYVVYTANREYSTLSGDTIYCTTDSKDKARKLRNMLMLQTIDDNNTNKQQPIT